MAVEQARAFIVELLEGLVHLHNHNVTHRDLKPANILVDEQRQHIKICDFGEAKAATAATCTGTFRGTPCYMAPEVGKGRYNLKVDVYAVAVMVMEMLGVAPAAEHSTRSAASTCVCKALDACVHSQAEEYGGSDRSSRGCLQPVLRVQCASSHVAR